MTIGMMEFGLVLACLVVLQAYLGLRMFREWLAEKAAGTPCLPLSSNSNAKSGAAQADPLQSVSETKPAKLPGFGARPRVKASEGSSGINPSDNPISPERKRGLASFAPSA